MLDIEELKKDANSPEIKKKVVDDINSAKAFGVTATPTYRIGIKNTRFNAL